VPSSCAAAFTSRCSLGAPDVKRALEALSYAGLDEKSFGRGGHHYVSVLHDISGRRVIEAVPGRTRKGADTPRATLAEAHGRRSRRWQ